VNCILHTFSLDSTAFLLPHQISGSGVSGLDVIIFYATGIPMGYTYPAINVVLILAGLKILGVAFYYSARASRQSAVGVLSG
jgi:uncharacterized membrane-anchored protein YitT (DUF2179 family)